MESYPDKTQHLLVGITGSVAAIKLQNFLTSIRERFYKQNESSLRSELVSLSVRIVFTSHAYDFVSKEQCDRVIMEIRRTNSTTDDIREFGCYNMQHLPNRPAFSVEGVYDDSSETEEWKRVGDSVLHITLRNWADLFVIAPLSANTMSKIANGMADNLLTCIARSWPIRQKAFIVAPAMNTAMYCHPLTTKHLNILTQELGIVVVPPVTKVLACGDFGVGAMASVDAIANEVFACLPTSVHPF